MAGMRMYAELARWWPLLSPPADYAEEAPFFLGLLREGGRAPRALLELGCGGGSLAWHLKRHAELTLVDLSPDMLAVCRATNPECEALEGDMRSLRLGRVFDAVLVHDAIMYATSEADLAATIDTAARHCAPGGTVILAPDFTRETFAPAVGDGGEDGGGRSLRFIEWTWDPDPDDTTFEVAYTFFLRDADGATRIEDDRHREGLFAEATWLRLMDQAGLDARAVEDPWRERIFTGRRRA
jgi:SAM-dependent methyltransferase